MPASAHWFEPGTDEYAAATSPHNSSGRQRPAFVVTVDDAAGVAAAVRECAERGLILLPQTTGHGAGGQVGADTVVLDTSRLTALDIDADRRVATAGAGLTWGAVNAAAERHGLLGLAGSSPSVCISGYTFGGGIGWLSRPHGLAAGALRRVDYVDGHGRLRSARDDADDQLDRDALWAFRGAGGVGVATELEFDLVPAPDLHAGYLLWPVEALADLATAWAAGLGRVSDDVATSLGVLRLPPAPPFPPELRGRTVVHLALAASRGADGAAPLLELMRAAGTPLVDTWGAADAATLGGIHLDPPAAVPALGEARWLTADAPAHAAELLGIVTTAGSPVVMAEIRSVGNAAAARPGALTRVPGPFLVHAVAPLIAPEGRPAIEDAFARLRTSAAPVDAGQSAGSWLEGATSAPDALPAPARERLAAIADAVDPRRVVRRTRFLA